MSIGASLFWWHPSHALAVHYSWIYMPKCLNVDTVNLLKPGWFQSFMVYDSSIVGAVDWFWTKCVDW